MSYKFTLDRALPKYLSDTADIKSFTEESGQFIYNINFSTTIEYDEFCEVVYSILDISGSVESVA